MYKAPSAILNTYIYAGHNKLMS